MLIGDIMFTDIELKEIYAKKHASYPKLARDLKHIGVVKYDYDVTDGKMIYYGKNNHTLAQDSKYPPIKINSEPSKNYFIKILRMHQRGETDFMKFCNDAAESGVAIWIANFEEMKVSYYDLKNNLMYEENIPEAD